MGTPSPAYVARQNAAALIGHGLVSPHRDQRIAAWQNLQATRKPQRTVQQPQQQAPQQPQQQAPQQQWGPQQWIQMGGWMQNQWQAQQQQVQQAQQQQRARPWFFAPRPMQAPQQFVPQSQRQYRPQPSRTLAEQLGLFGRGMQESMNAARGY